MVRISAFLLILMASTVLADDFNTVQPRRFNVDLGDPAPALVPAPRPDPAGLIAPLDPPKETSAGPAGVNFNYDPVGKRMRHAHLVNGRYVPCNDTRCSVPIPKNLEICPRCNWSICQCADPMKGMPPAPHAGTMQSFRGQGGPRQGGGQCHQHHAPAAQKKFFGGWMQVCSLRADAALSLPKRNCGCDECNGRTEQCIPGNVVVSGGVYLPFGLKPGITLTR